MEIPRFDDWDFISNCIGHSNGINYVKKHLYYYVDNQTSSVHRYTNALDYAQTAFNHIRANLVLPDDIFEVLFNREVLYVAIKQLAKDNSHHEFKKQMAIVHSCFPNYKVKLNNAFSLHQNVILLLYKMKAYHLLLFLLKRM